MKRGRTPKSKSRAFEPTDNRKREMRPVKAGRAVEADHVIYGTLPVAEALSKRPRSVKLVMIAEGVRERRFGEIVESARVGHVRVEQVPSERLDGLLGTDVNHQGIAALTAPIEFIDLDDLIDGIAGMPLLVILDGVEDPRNLGAVIRTAECAGADGVIIPERRAAGLTGAVSKTAAGATEFIKLSQVTNISRTVEKMKRNSIWVIGTADDAEMSYQDWDWTQPSAVILGSEGSGMHRLVRENCDVLVKIPMYGKISSLNVSVAAGVILFEARRQRDLKERS